MDITIPASPADGRPEISIKGAAKILISGGRMAILDIEDEPVLLPMDVKI